MTYLVNIGGCCHDCNRLMLRAFIAFSWKTNDVLWGWGPKWNQTENNCTYVHTVHTILPLVCQNFSLGLKNWAAFLRSTYICMYIHTYVLTKPSYVHSVHSVWDVNFTSHTYLLYVHTFTDLISDKHTYAIFLTNYKVDWLIN